MAQGPGTLSSEAEAESLERDGSEGPQTRARSSPPVARQLAVGKPLGATRSRKGARHRGRDGGRAAFVVWLGENSSSPHGDSFCKCARSPHGRRGLASCDDRMVRVKGNLLERADLGLNN